MLRSFKASWPRVRRGHTAFLGVYSPAGSPARYATGVDRHANLGIDLPAHSNAVTSRSADCAALHASVGLMNIGLMKIIGLMKTANTSIAAFRIAKSAGRSTTVHITCSDVAVGPSIADWNAIGHALALEPVPVSRGPDADIHVRLAPALLPHPEGATRVSRDERGAVWRDPTGWWVERAAYTARLAPNAPHATLAMTTALASEGETAHWAHAFRDVLTLLLPRTDRMPLHAAALRAPSAYTGLNALLLVGPSGCSKSTLTTGLLLRGWRCISDDMLVLSPPAETAPMRAHSLAQTIHVCEDAWERLALNRSTEVSPSSLFGQFTERAKRPLTQQALPDNERFAAHPAAYRAPCAKPDCIVLPTITDAPTSCLAPVSRADALTALMEQGVPAALLPADATRTQWQQMGCLIRQCATYRLRAGLDLYHDPGHLATLLRASADPSV